MQIGQLTTLAKLRVPAFTALFSDALSISSMAVVAGGNITLTCSSSHGLATGASEWVSITQALAPNAITALAVLDGTLDGTMAGDVQVTTTYSHTLTHKADTMFASYQDFATLTVPGTAALTGAIQLVTVIDKNNFVVRPGAVTLPDPIPAGSALLEPLEIEIVGLNVATATSPTVLTLPTPASVTRSYTVASPIVVRNLRMFGAVDYAHAVTHITDAAPTASRAYLYICPVRTARMSRDWLSTSDANQEVTPNAAYRAKLLDGFDIFVFIPTQKMQAAVGAMDAASGEVLTAIVQTFNGIRLPFTEWNIGGKAGRYVAAMLNHGVQAYDKVWYCHRFSFEAIVTLSADNVADPVRMPDLTSTDTTLPPGGTVPWETAVYDGIYQSDKPQALEGHVPMDTN